MKKLTGALALSLSLLWVPGCRCSAETRPEAPSSTGPGLDLALDSGAGPAAAEPHQGMSAGKPAAPLSDADRQAQERCVDAWLTDKKLDKYGSAEGTMYTGGTPLFDERTGETRDRLQFVYERQPEAQKACATAK